MQGKYLLINNNNTRTKFALADENELLDDRAIKTSNVSIECIAEVIAGWEYESVVLASVVPRDIPTLIESQAGYPMIEVGHEINLGVNVDFPKPQSIGADRLANAAAVVDVIDQQPVIVVDFGTAVTFDIVDQSPAYIGGVIAPGLESMTRYLHHRTALLPKIDIREPDSAIGKSTKQAMLSGAYHGYSGFVIEIINQIESELSAKAKIFATGGYAELISQDLSVIDTVDPLLTLKGMQKIARLNKFSKA